MSAVLQAMTGEERVEFESEGIDVDAEVAADIAFCLSEALAMTKKTVETATAARHMFQMSSNLRFKNLRADGKVEVTGVVMISPMKPAYMGKLASPFKQSQAAATRS
ncbi:hypothetical protein AO263_28905 [Pseudomonas sp. NZIPFR-PS5]|nr:hypothetical protein AO263_28905 [Pseudomonas sp. NZIPFR-PS5]